MNTPAMTPGAGVPFPEFIEERFAPGEVVWIIQADEHDAGPELYGGLVPADGSEDYVIEETWEMLRRWDFGVWGAAFDGDSGCVRCGWFIDAAGEHVVVTYRYPDPAPASAPASGAA